MKKFDQELDQLRGNVVKMGVRAREMLESVVAVLDDSDGTVTKNIYANEHWLDQMELEIDHEAIRLMTVYTPVASDLRLILSVTRITQELERVGDQAVNMCEYLELLATQGDVPVMPVVRKMGQLVIEMLRESMESFAESDSDKALMVIRSDNRVDALDDQVLQDSLGSDARPISISKSLAVILISRSLERIADQATNICESVVYMTKGADIRHNEDVKN